ncbi:MAG: DoxX family protein [Pyrinomonadaceae bacterium]
MNILLWILQILLGLLFMFAGATKFIMSYADMTKDSPVKLPHWFYLFIGVCEILGGLGLILPWATKIRPGLTPLAAWLLVVIMIGAVVTSIPMGIVYAITPFVVGLLLILIGYQRMRGLRQA